MQDAVIFMPIRMNSKRILNKNLQKICEMPMFCWSLNKIKDLGVPVYVYSNWPDELKQAAMGRFPDTFDKKYENVTFLKRPHKLDNDTTLGIDIYKTFAAEVPAKVYMLVHCTSPFVKRTTYMTVMQSVISTKYESASTVQKIKTFSWYKNSPLNFSLPRPRTQDIEPVYVETSGAYCYTREVLALNQRSSEKNNQVIVDNIEAVDIDTPLDLDYARSMATYYRLQKGSEYDFKEY